MSQKKCFYLLTTLFLCTTLVYTLPENDSSSEEEAEITLEKANETLAKIEPQLDANLKREFELQSRDPETASFVERASTSIDEAEIKTLFENQKEQLSKYHDVAGSDMTLKRQFDLLRDFKCGKKGEEHAKALKDITEEFFAMDEDLKLCSYENKSDCSISYSTFVDKERQSSDDPDEVLYYFTEIRTKTGEYLRRKFSKLIEEYQLLAACNNMTASQMFLHPFEDDTILDILGKIMEDLEPLYLQLHAYFRHILNQKYGSTIIPESEPIREDIFIKFMFKRNFMRHTPFPNKPFPDVEGEMKKQNYDGLKIMKLADDLFASMNMTRAPKHFWTNFVQKYDHSYCEPQALGVLVRDNVGFYYCDKVSFKTFMLTYTEMTKVQYNLNMNHLHVAYRLGMWPGFIEGVSKAVQSAISNMEYIKDIGLSPEVDIDPDLEIKGRFLGLANALALIRLEYVYEKLRVDILDGKVEPDEYNTKFWEQAEKYCGLRPPVKRSAYDFDTGLHLRFFDTRNIADILENIWGAQIYEGLCKIAQSTQDEKPLKRCNFLGNVAVGNKLKEAMSLGASKHWKEILEILTGDCKLKASSMINYYEPVRQWLEDYNTKNKVAVGWGK